MNRLTLAVSWAGALSLCLAACTVPDQSDGSAPAPGSGNSAAGTRPAGEPQEVTLEGRIESGVECPVLHTPDGRIFALSLGKADFGPGDFVSITGEFADASICMQGEGTLIPTHMEATSPPARDRDPARAGGMAVTSDYVRGSWVAKGVNADCTRPDFDVTANSRGMNIVETRINGYPETGVVDVGPGPALQWDEPLPTLPIETRGPDGLAVMPPASGEVVTLAGHRIEGDGVVFVRCSR